ncbi:cobalamin biosynthesis protein CobS [Intrasporangium oryzae NRRL B-24470]|uniref:Adenosylcobinamide-GDP ribazoletransferase n=1 Tax=Intrasporangium oryzae NRRL B-24470 TaxID=1386089 RepID=W9G703_9MICO|nr:adenosylcobinamide-GDP ribazoletransferase [Intrasporangium oryzae]EWT00588.1 cobalamin biosynthesis protein CobS [Intrasporangium oryzae NRRL B-24470]
MRDGWRLAVGTFLAVPVRPPSRVDGRVAGQAMLLAPATALVLAGVWVVLGGGVVRGWVPGLLAGALAVATTALGSRAMHLDGLADTADGLSASYDRARALEVMRRGDVGPSGVAALVLTVLVQVASLEALLERGAGVAVAALALVASRLAPAVSCRRGVPAARAEGLGHTVAGTVGVVPLGAVTALVTATGLGVLLALGGAWYAAPCVVGAAILASWALTRRATRRLGGVTGDVVGAGVEVSLAAALVVGAFLLPVV